MVMRSDDEAALIRSILTALRAIKVRDIDKVLVALSKGDRGGSRLNLGFTQVWRGLAMPNPFTRAVAIVG
ncbi:hypothetical protein IFO70_00305 [Phormidium tenue FACHB-886]|nr:hypothetical protein [Phormidium tenue FACHB-886]